MPGAVGDPGQPPHAPRVRHFRRRVFLAVLRLAQCVTVVVLLVLASVVDSPSQPGRKQSRVRDVTPKPELYQTWLSISAFRLFALVLVGTWTLHRDWKRTAPDADVEENGTPLVEQPRAMPQQPRPASTATQPIACPSTATVNLHPYRSTTSVNRSTVTLGRSSLYTTPGAASSATSWVTAASPASPRSMSPALERDGGSISPAAHLYAIPDAADTLASLASLMPGNSGTGNSGPSTPSLAQASTPFLPLQQPAAVAASTHSLPPISSRPVSGRIAYPAPAATSTASLALPQSRSTASLALPSPARASSRSNSRPPSRAFPESSSHITTIPEQAPTNPYPEPYVPLRDRRKAVRGIWAKKIDRFATCAHYWLQAAGWVLFFVGFPLLFALNGETTRSAYKASPFLWWGVFTVVLSKWLYLAMAIALVTFGVFMLTFLRVWANICERMGWQNRFPPPRFEKPVIKLTRNDLNRLPVVCYLPHPDEPAPVPSIYGDGHSVRSGREPEGSFVLPGQADPSRLNTPSVELSSHHATCAICQSSFLAPRDIPGRVMYEVTKLRQLPCRHYFHVDCVDKWLLEHSSVCPYCNRSVRDMLDGKEKTEGGEGEGRAAEGERQAAQGEGQAPADAAR